MNEAHIKNIIIKAYRSGFEKGINEASREGRHPNTKKKTRVIGKIKTPILVEGIIADLQTGYYDEGLGKMTCEFDGYKHYNKIRRSLAMFGLVSIVGWVYFIFSATSLW